MSSFGPTPSDGPQYRREVLELARSGRGEEERKRREERERREGALVFLSQTYGITTSALSARSPHKVPRQHGGADGRGGETTGSLPHGKPTPVRIEGPASWRLTPQDRVFLSCSSLVASGLRRPAGAQPQGFQGRAKSRSRRRHRHHRTAPRSRGRQNHGTS